MIDTEAAKLCEMAVRISSSVSDCVPARATRSEVLDRFWGLQDTIARLVGRASDFPREVFETLSQSHPQLLSEVAYTLEDAEQRRMTSLGAVRWSCAAIKNSLLELEILQKNRSSC
jgi:hypothetical protein